MCRYCDIVPVGDCLCQAVACSVECVLRGFTSELRAKYDYLPNGEGLLYTYLECFYLNSRNTYYLSNKQIL